MIFAAWTGTIFPAASIQQPSPIKDEIWNEAKEDIQSAAAPSADAAAAASAVAVPSIDPRRRVGVIRRLTPKEILNWLRRSNPHLQRTDDRYKYHVEQVDAKTRTLRYPVLETKVAALLPSSSSGGHQHLVREGNDCVSVFDETNFFSDECKESSSSHLYKSVCPSVGP